jgi:glycosyltransferase involved in cell wall biosynthesis
MGRGEAMHPPLVSIIIPVYNGANYMRAAIDSALAQDYPRIEIIVVNDGSMTMARPTGSHAPTARACVTSASRMAGVASALNEGLAAMQGDVFCWLSHDDIHLPDKTSRQVAEWERLGRPNEVLIGDYRLIDASGGWCRTSGSTTRC